MRPASSFLFIQLSNSRAPLLSWAVPVFHLKLVPPYIRWYNVQISNEQCGRRKNKTRHACMEASGFDGCHRAKPVSETERSGVERALRSKTPGSAADGKPGRAMLAWKRLVLTDAIGRSP